MQRVNPEYIFGYYRAPNRDFEGFYNPPSRGGSTNRSLATQDLVDCFPMKNGLQPLNTDGSVNVASGYSATNPYVNRDPRLTIPLSSTVQAILVLRAVFHPCTRL